MKLDGHNLPPSHYYIRSEDGTIRGSIRPHKNFNMYTGSEFIRKGYQINIGHTEFDFTLLLPLDTWLKDELWEPNAIKEIEYRIEKEYKIEELSPWKIEKVKINQIRGEIYATRRDKNNNIAVSITDSEVFFHDKSGHIVDFGFIIGQPEIIFAREWTQSLYDRYLSPMNVADTILLGTECPQKSQEEKSEIFQEIVRNIKIETYDTKQADIFVKILEDIDREVKRKIPIIYCEIGFTCSGNEEHTPYLRVHFKNNIELCIIKRYYGHQIELKTRNMHITTYAPGNWEIYKDHWKDFIEELQKIP